MSEEKVSITGLLSVLYKHRKLIIKVTGVFLVIGLILYVVNPREYSTRTVLLPESENGSMLGSLSSLASLAGVNIESKGGSSGLNSTLYEEILTSTPFLHQIVVKTYYFPSIDRKTSLSDYLANYSKQPLLKNIVETPKRAISFGRRLFSPSEPEMTVPTPVDTTKQTQDSLAGRLMFNSHVLTLSGIDKKAISELKDRISYALDIKTGLVKMSVELQDKKVCAEVLKEVIDELTQYVSLYETQKERRNLEFVETQLKEAEKKYLDAQMKLAAFRDRNRNIILSTAAARGERLQAQYNLEFNVYNSLRQQYEQLQLKVSEETPSLSVLEPPQSPTSPYKPNLLLIVLISLFLGLFVGCTYVLVKKSVITIINA